jgi:hypothetical protein
VCIGKVLSPPLDCGERDSIDSTPGLVWRTRSPPLIHHPLEIWAYIDSSEEEEEKEGDEIKELGEQLAMLKLRLNNMDEHVAESEIEHMCHTRFRKGNRMHLICAPGSSSTHMIDVTSVYPK